MGSHTKATSDSSFEKDVLTSSTPVLVDFWAEWCGPCRRLSPTLEEIGSELEGKVQIMKVNIDENPETPSRYGVRSVPTMMLFKGGEEKGLLIGAHPKEAILDFLKKNLG